jgi:3',5'-cyclic-AMP phosphodiesterase
MIPASPLRLAQITDIHLFAHPDRKLLGVKTLSSFEAVLRGLLSLNYARDMLLLTGDLSQDKTPESYQVLQNLLRPWQIPTYWIPGNHDNLSVMESVLQEAPFSEDKSFERGNWQFILLNSQVPGANGGRLSRTSLEWLDWQLYQAGNRPTLIALHHPPFPVNSEWLDQIKLENSEAFFEVLDRYRNVKLVACGHVHQNLLFYRENVAYFATPSTCVQFKPKSIEFALDEASPGFRLFNLYPNGTWETKVERVAIALQPDLTAVGY